MSNNLFKALLPARTGDLFLSVTMGIISKIYKNRDKDRKKLEFGCASHSRAGGFCWQGSQPIVVICL